MTADLKAYIADQFRVLLGDVTVEVEMPSVWFCGEHFIGEQVTGGWRFVSDQGNSLFVPAPPVGPVVVETAIGWSVPLIR